MGVNPESQSHDQLYVSRSEVIWYEGLNLDSRTVRKVYRTETPVLQVFWCNFLEEGRMGAGGGKRGCGSVCIMEHSCLGVYMATGAVHYVPFPFPVSHLEYYLEEVVLMQCCTYLICSVAITTYFNLSPVISAMLIQFVSP